MRIKSKLKGIKFKPTYGVLAKGSDFEVRLYLPCKRTVKIMGRFYFLPIPYMVYGKYTGANKNGTIGTWLYVAMTDRKLTKKSLGKLVYYTPLGNVSGWQACLDNPRLDGNFDPNRGHYVQPLEDAFEDLLYKFWSHEFNNAGMKKSLTAFGGRLHEWAKMTPKQALKAVPNIEYKIPLSMFIGMTAKGAGADL
jgi:hypothetical protein